MIVKEGCGKGDSALKIDVRYGIGVITWAGLMMR